MSNNDIDRIVKAVDAYGETLLHKMATDYNYITEIAQFFVSHGADVNATNNEHETPLHLAAACGNIEFVKFLVSQGADVHAGEDDCCDTPLHSVVGGTESNENHVEVIKFLLAQGADINAKNKSGDTPLDCARARNHLDIIRYIEYLFQRQMGNTGIAQPLTAAEQEKIDNFCAKYGSDVNVVDEETGWTLLHRAARIGCVVLVRFLISKGADVNAKTKTGETPLHFGVCENCFEIVRLLVSAGAVINVKDEDDVTPIDCANARGNMDIVKYFSQILIENTDYDSSFTIDEQEIIDNFCAKYGSNVKTVSGKSGLTLLHRAARIGSVILVRFLISKGADVNAKTKTGETPLAFATVEGNVYVAQSLVVRGANVNEKGLLHSAARSGKIALVKFFVSKGHDVNAKDSFGNTPLHEAAFGGNVRIVKFLISKGADVNAKNVNGIIPLGMTKSKAVGEYLSGIRGCP